VSPTAFLFALSGMLRILCKSIYLPTTTIMKVSKTDAFTLIELLVVISIIAILAGIALPVFGSVQIKGAQTKALSNAKQIGTALRLYAVDNNGTYPSYDLGANGKPATPPVVVSSSNAAFAQLIPDYLPNEDIFWLTKSAWCNPTPPDNQMDAAGVYTPVLTLADGENEWAYAPGLNDTSNPTFPVIADGFATGSESDPVYVEGEAVEGGVWKGKNAIVIRCDTSGSVTKVDRRTLKVIGPVNAVDGAEDNIFKSTPATWLPKPIVNPL
jgi:prepilin-type N-terminal cleavage/methylation domain-containing protein